MALFLTCSRLTRPSLKNHIPLVSALFNDKHISTSYPNKAENFLEKNERLKRPLSPHITIYKFPLTAMLSITHRGTGLALSGTLYAFSVGMLLLPANFPHYIDLLQSMHLSSAAIFTFKFALAWMASFHTVNGVRHLIWDMGYGYDLKNLATAGYLVIGTSLVSSAIIASM